LNVPYTYLAQELNKGSNMVIRSNFVWFTLLFAIAYDGHCATTGFIWRD